MGEAKYLKKIGQSLLKIKRNSPKTTIFLYMSVFKASSNPNEKKIIQNFISLLLYWYFV